MRILTIQRDGEKFNFFLETIHGDEKFSLGKDWLKSMIDKMEDGEVYRSIDSEYPIPISGLSHVRSPKD